MKKITSFLLSIIVAFILVFSLSTCDKDNNDDDNNGNPQIEISGCTNSESLNYNPSATIDDGSCVMPPQGEFKAIVILFTATGCQYCGMNGYVDFNRLKDDNGKKIVPISVHTEMGSDPMYNSTFVSGFVKTFPATGVPNFFIVNEKSTSQAVLDNKLANFPLLADVAFVSTESQNQIEVTAQVQFYNNPAGPDVYSADFYISAYLLESNIDGSPGSGAYLQNGIADLEYEDTYVHNNVLRATSNPNNVFGKRFAICPVPDDTTITKTLQLDIDPSWNKDNLDIAVVVWTNLIGTTAFLYVNGADDREL